MKFADLNIQAELKNNLDSLGYHEPTPIQALSLPSILDGKDVIAQAQTGSGKTVAFALGLLAKTKLATLQPQSLVLCPTRELAEQVAGEIRRLARRIANFKVLSLCGGIPIAPQTVSLEHGAHCIVGTPGRIQDHLSRNTLNLSKIKTFVLDEADRMLEMGFAETLMEIIGKLPQVRQSLLFSATYPPDIHDLSQSLQSSALLLRCESELSDPTIEQTFVECPEDKRISALMSILDHSLVQHKVKKAVVFCNTKQKCKEVSDTLNAKGFSASCLNADLTQFEREQALILFANGSITVLVATDIAARGLDVKDLDLVINFDLPRLAAAYVHRIGRTGRAGAQGQALSFYGSHDQELKQSIEDMQTGDLRHKKLSDWPKSPSSMRQAAMISLRINGGRKTKLRAGDILGGLTRDNTLTRDHVGKINVLANISYVAIKREHAKKAQQIMASGKMKRRQYKTMRLP